MLLDQLSRGADAFANHGISVGFPTPCLYAVAHALFRMCFRVANSMRHPRDSNRPHTDIMRRWRVEVADVNNRGVLGVGVVEILVVAVALR